MYGIDTLYLAPGRNTRRTFGNFYFIIQLRYHSTNTHYSPLRAAQGLRKHKIIGARQTQLAKKFNNLVSLLLAHLHNAGRLKLLDDLNLRTWHEFFRYLIKVC